MVDSPAGVIVGAISGPQSVSISQPPSAPSSLASKYRGAVVEDLQLSPAVCVSVSATLNTALSIAHDHDYSQLPVMSAQGRKLQGYLDVETLQARLREGKAKGEDKVEGLMKSFQRREGSAGGKGNTFTVIEPNTGLAELETFLQSHPFALVTDPGRAFVLGVATRQDLDKYVQRRGLGGPSTGGAGVGAGGGGDDETMRDASGDVTAGPSVAAGGSALPQMSRREEEERRKDRTLAEFLGMLDGYDPLIPDEVTTHYLERAGFETTDARLKRLLSLAAEKFVSDIATDAFQYARIRASAGPGKGRGGAKERARTVLTMDDLSAALSEYGVNARRSDFYR